jgi:hypothetical protein
MTFTASSGAPQEAAGAAMASAVVIIPYVFTRAIEALSSNKLEQQNEKIIELLERRKQEQIV